MFSGNLATDPALGALSAAAGEVVAQVRDGAFAGASVHALGQTLVTIRQAQAQLEWAALQVVREVDLSAAYRSEGAVSTKSWLTQTARMGPREADEAVRTARGLGSGALDATSKALSEGDIDRAHAVTIATGTAGAPVGAVSLIEPLAVAAALESPPGRVAEVMREFRTALDPDEADRAAVRRYEARGLSAAVTLDGMVAGRFLLDPAAGATLLTGLDAASPLDRADPRTPAQQRADGLITMASHFLNTADLPRTAGARPHVIITRAGDQASADEADTIGSSPGLSWVGPMPVSTADRASCDARLTVVGLDPDGEVTELSGQRRYFTWAQRLAIIARDGDRCPWPTCDRPIWWSDAHHLHPFSKGGPTTVTNGALPCEGHHVLLHEGHWTLSRLADGRYVARHPSGRTYGPEPYRRTNRSRSSRPPPRRRE